MTPSIRPAVKSSPEEQALRFGRHMTLSAFIADLRARLAAARRTADAFRRKADETANSSLRIYFTNTAATYQVIAESHETAIERLLQEQSRQAKPCEP
jgi:hypothetical protein